MQPNATVLRDGQNQDSTSEPPPGVHGRGGPDLYDDFAVGRLRGPGLVLHRKEIGHCDVM